MDRDRIHEAKMLALKGAWEAARLGNDYMPQIRKHHMEQLKEIAANAHLGISHVRIVASGPGGWCCRSCSAMDDKVLNLATEQSVPTLPVSGCTCTAYNDEQLGFCLCRYEPVFDDEL